ncbi:uncharacterized protein LOC134202827 isoform X2 [Armigeres subalbatus]|uniref:uncharacterized protein LOC134202827 isoform X2 n=1 Tax=Armigeres subalbatus TaxID=124917 RepID=UPI002ED0E094
MSANDSAVSSAHPRGETRTIYVVQPGRIMAWLRSGKEQIDDKVIHQIALKAGDVPTAHVHRSRNPRQIFIQYADPSVVDRALPRMKQITIFNQVERAFKSVKSTGNKTSGGGNQKSSNIQQQKKVTISNQISKGGGTQQQKGLNISNHKTVVTSNTATKPSPTITITKLSPAITANAVDGARDNFGHNVAKHAATKVSSFQTTNTHGTNLPYELRGMNSHDKSFIRVLLCKVAARFISYSEKE